MHLQKVTQYDENGGCCSVSESCLTLCNPMPCSMPGFPVLHYLPVCTDSCPLNQWCQSTMSSSVAPFPPTLNLFQYQGLFQIPKNGGSSVYGVGGLLVSFFIFKFYLLVWPYQYRHPPTPHIYHVPNQYYFSPSIIFCFCFSPKTAPLPSFDSLF